MIRAGHEVPVIYERRGCCQMDGKPLLFIKIYMNLTYTDRVTAFAYNIWISKI